MGYSKPNANPAVKVTLIRWRWVYRLYVILSSILESEGSIFVGSKLANTRTTRSVKQKSAR